MKPIARVLAAGLLASAAALPLPAGAANAPDLYALVIGIDKFERIRPLTGAVNDARDIEQALRKAGAKEIRVLVDGEASLANIKAAWKDLIAKAPKDATVILTFATHGAQSDERVKGSEEDGKDEFIVLPRFYPRGEEVNERLLDDDIAQMLQDAAPRSVIVVSDTCHSGTMTRSIDPRVSKPSVRAATFGPLEEESLAPPNPKAAAAEKAPQPHVTFFAAVSDQEEAPEVAIDGQMRGALSWSFARALEGQADADKDGVTTKEELERFIRENIRMKVEGRQHPQVTRGGSPSDRALVIPPADERPPVPLSSADAAASTQTQAQAATQSPAKPEAAPPAQTGTAAAPPTQGGPQPGGSQPQGKPNAPEAFLLRITNPPAGKDPISLAISLRGAKPAGENTAGAFVWDVTKGEVVSPLGDVVAVVQDPNVDTQLKRVQGVIDKWRALKALEKQAQSRSLEVRLIPGDNRHAEGSKVKLSVGGHKATYFTLINLASDGTVNFLYPLNDGSFKDPPQIKAAEPYTLTLEVTPPFGADHFVAIATPEPLDALHTELKAIDGKAQPIKVQDLLATHLGGKEHQLGLHGVYTGPK